MANVDKQANTFSLRVMVTKAEFPKVYPPVPGEDKLDASKMRVEAVVQMEDGTGRPCQFQPFEIGKGGVCGGEKILPFVWFDVGGRLMPRQSVRMSTKGGPGASKSFVSSDWGLNVLSFQPAKV